VLYTAGMEFASEMVVKIARAGLKISELPIKYERREGESKLQTFVDGWRHLRFILLYSPLMLFLIPGAIIFFLGFVGLLVFYFKDPVLFGFKFYFHPMFIWAMFLMLGYQLVFFAGYAKIYAINHLGDKDAIIEKLFTKITLEKASIIGIILILFGFIIFGAILAKWLGTNTGSLNEIKNSILALVFMVMGVQTIFSSFMLSILGIKEK
jgi:hypothetical protein